MPKPNANTTQPLGARGLYVHRPNANVDEHVHKTLNDMVKIENVNKAVQDTIETVLKK